MKDCGSAPGLSCRAISVVVLGHVQTTVPAQRRIIDLCTWPQRIASILEKDRRTVTGDDLAGEPSHVGPPRRVQISARGLPRQASCGSSR